MKLAYEDKLEIYRLWKQERWVLPIIAKKFNITKSHAAYIFNLIDKHGIEIVKHGKKKIIF